MLAVFFPAHGRLELHPENDEQSVIGELVMRKNGNGEENVIVVSEVHDLVIEGD